MFEPVVGVEVALADEVEDGGAECGSDEGKGEDEQPPVMDFTAEEFEGWEGKEGNDEGQGVCEVVAEVENTLDFLEGCAGRGEDGGEEFFCGLDGAFGPAELLAFEGGVGFGDFSGHDDVRDVFEVPATELCAVGEVQVFGEGVGSPAAGVFDGGAAPDAAGAVEVEEEMVGAACGLFDSEVAVDADGLGACEEGCVAIEVAPAGLDEGSFFGVEVGEEFCEKIRWWDEVAIKDGDKFAMSGGHCGRQGPGFVAGALGAADDIDPGAVGA